MTVLGANSSRDGISVHPLQLELGDNATAQLTILNHTAKSRDLRIELISQADPAVGCDIHYSPKVAAIPSSTSQVLRIVAYSPGASVCQTEHTLLVIDQLNPDTPLFEIPIGSKSGPDYGSTFFGAP